MSLLRVEHLPRAIALHLSHITLEEQTELTRLAEAISLEALFQFTRAREKAEDRPGWFRAVTLHWAACAAMEPDPEPEPQPERRPVHRVVRRVRR